jgi:hypothetical protein
MGITKFIYILLIVAIAFLFYKQEENKAIANSEKKPLLIFEHSIMYDITNNGVNQIVQFEKAFVYKDLEKLYESTIVTRSGKDLSTNTMRSKEMIKKGDNLSLFGDVHLLNNNDFNLETEELQYNLRTKIAKNKTKFILQKSDHLFNGSDLYLDTINYNIKAKNTHFKIKLKDLNDTK